MTFYPLLDPNPSCVNSKYPVHINILNCFEWAVMLLNLPESTHSFNMAIWLKVNEEGYSTDPYDYTPKLAHNYVECNTVGCALGYAALHNIGQPDKYEHWNNYLNSFIKGLPSNLFAKQCRDVTSGHLWHNLDNSTRGAALRLFALIHCTLNPEQFKQILTPIIDVYYNLLDLNGVTAPQMYVQLRSDYNNAIKQIEFLIPSITSQVQNLNC